ncbi:extracellular matrix regulator RemB [Pectinatus brassicae]|uniref:Regulator of extracellular matrix RemA (YlzA/DUF370 family) n=1 Tax=Pectinatus brassicae TaxID=862415 RepID=A0A840UQF2_9FIRM|nr:extracellular matrix/biofilm biosynthesis regulator RemA family protein [Pectinatus brassicae]MBB5336938.1 regulator of extracellular matrix RemA (YlzA/DUF370 family) [Pectinatus brassicae]
MFLHIGYNITIPLKSIIAIYNLQGNKNKSFLSSMRHKNKVIDLSDRAPKSCIITDSKIYLSSISVNTLQKRNTENTLFGD